MKQLKWQRITLLSVLGYEGAGAALGGVLLIMEPGGKLMNMPVEIMHGGFRDFLIPGFILLGLGILNLIAFFSVLLRTSEDWFMTGIALGGLLIWFSVEIIILRELHWLHAMWGIPVLLGWTVAIPLIAARTHASLTSFLLICGILSSVLYIGVDIFAAALWEGYSYTSQSVSELFAIDAPTRYMIIPVFIIYSFLVFAFGYGVWTSADRHRSLRVAAVLIIAKEVLGLAGTLFFPIHLRGVEGTAADTMHAVVTAVGVLLCMFPAMGFAAMAFEGKFRIYSIVTMVIFLVFGILTGLYGSSLAENLPTPWMGIMERINIYGYMLWVIVFATVLLNKDKKVVKVMLA